MVYVEVLVDVIAMSGRWIPSKYSVVGTLYHRAKTICSSTQLLQKEEEHLFQALKRCKYPTWALNRVKMRSQNPTKNRIAATTTKLGKTTRRMHIWWFHTTKGSVKASKDHAKNMGYKCTSKENLPSKTSLWLQRIKITS